MASKNLPFFEKVYKENLFIMKLLTTQPEFLDGVKKVRKKLGIPEACFKSAKERNKWHENFFKTLPEDADGLYHPKSIFSNAEKLVKKYGLRYNFWHYIATFIMSNEVDAPKYNFDVSLGPDPRGPRHDKWVSIKAYAPLTKIEIKRAVKKLLELQKEFLPSRVTLDIRPKIDIDKALQIEEEMEERGTQISEQPSYYLEQVRKSYGEAEYRRVAKLNPENLEREIVKYTSKDIAEKFFGSRKKDILVRQIYSRLKAKRKQLFPCA